MKHFRPELQTTEAVVVRTNNFGESDRLINIVTPHHGLIRGIVKGAKKPRSRIGGPLDLLKFVKLSVKRLMFSKIFFVIKMQMIRLNINQNGETTNNQIYFEITKSKFM